VIRLPLSTLSYRWTIALILTGCLAGYVRHVLDGVAEMERERQPFKPLSGSGSRLLGE